MAYNHAYLIDDLPARDLRKLLVWCHQNLSRPADWDFSDETGQGYNGDTISTPRTIYFNNQSDITAMVLALGLRIEDVGDDEDKNSR